MNVDNEDLAAQAGGIEGVLSAAVEEVEPIEALPEAIEVAPPGGNTEVASAGEDTWLCLSLFVIGLSPNYNFVCFISYKCKYASSFSSILLLTKTHLTLTDLTLTKCR